jgi:hypothetical protein
MVIARTARDNEYNSKVDEFVSRAISCFVTPDYPIGRSISLPSMIPTAFGTLIQTLESGIDDDVIQAALAKSVCSCHFISGLNVGDCIDRSNIPGAAALNSVSVSGHEVDVELSWLAGIIGLHWGKRTRASFDPAHPEYGCTLL